MQQTIQKSIAPAAAKPWWHGNRAPYLGISAREYAFLARFSIRAETLGLKTTGISKGPFGRGARLALSSSNHDYEVHVDGTGHALLGRVSNDGKRIRLCEGGTNTEAQWESVRLRENRLGRH